MKEVMEVCIGPDFSLLDLPGMWATSYLLVAQALNPSELLLFWYCSTLKDR